MRKLPYVTLALAGLLLANVVASWALPGYRETLRSLRGEHSWTGSVLPPIEVAPAQGGVAAEDSGTGVAILGSEVVSGLQTVRVTHDPGLTPVPAEPTVATGAASSAEPTMPEALILRLIPKIVLEKTDKSRIFGRDFPGLAYATYADTRYELGAHAIDADMDTVRALFSDEEGKLADTDAFFGRTIFYNWLDDGRVRFFFSFGGKTVAMDLPSKHYYEILKPLLLP